MMREISGLLFGLAITGITGCGVATDGSNSDSEVATSVVSGALNNASAGALGWNDAPRLRKSIFDRVLEQLHPEGTAFAASWMCSGEGLSPVFSGPAGDPYAFTPAACSVSWGAGKSASSKWSGTFTLSYGVSCDSKHAALALQAGGCAVTRTTALGGNTRTITGPEGNAYAITHDTDGAGSGWDSSVSPVPTNDGVVATCAAGGCITGATLAISGSHLTGVLTPMHGAARTIWDHTVSTAPGGLTVAVSGTNRVVTGTVTVQHNLAKYTATASFNGVTYGASACCFPTAGSVSTTFHNGADMGKTESLAFSATCGEATLTTANGHAVPITLQHCL